MRLNSIQVTIYWISSPSRSHLTPIQVSSCASHLHPCPISPSSRFLNSYVTSIQVAYYLHPGCSIQVHIFASHLHPGGVPYPPRMAFPHLAGPISPPPIMSPGVCLTSIQVPYQLHPGPKIWVSFPSRSRVTSIQVGRIASQLRARPISPPSSSRNMYISAIKVAVLLPSRSRD